MESSADLSARAAGGDRAAFSELMRQTKRALFRFIRRYVGDEQEAWDLLQETYAAAWINIRRYDPTRPFEAWIRTIALNKCRDWSRRGLVRRLIRGGVDLSSPEAMSVPDGAESADERMEARDRLARLNEAMSRLPPHLKAPLLLTTIEGRSQAETAGLLGVSTKTVETRVARARRKLSEALGGTAAFRAVPD
ncbi:MAG: sigma-70 family RNA polymerase sigma factor [Brevundimonas sp.]|uniref:RNA polymerase sigma factor n=1 Tax=Brevundimonas sp. TaxID=1871086 RepID=UPI002726BBB5|nr:sigma-70 family RNA polymerase sigma factor [Brevundimonas sp.]MDO9076339.1 sigma-70 family RNA polymerase sigma factor [Brevundimonas sp.]MDZ4061997.1 sigma-70 family RNA polymerase sigma factor [Brevundimonas sp.]